MTFDFSKKLFVSTIAEDCAAAAREHSLGLEIAEFCYAPNMDTDSAAHFRRVSQLTAESGCGLRLLLHAPFAELSPCAIDCKLDNSGIVEKQSLRECCVYK